MTLDHWKMVFGFLLLFLLCALAAVLAIGHVEEKTSFGLQSVITAIALIAGQFAQWAFGRKGD